MSIKHETEKNPQEWVLLFDEKGKLAHLHKNMKIACQMTGLELKIDAFTPSNKTGSTGYHVRNLIKGCVDIKKDLGKLTLAEYQMRVMELIASKNPDFHEKN